MAYQPAKRTRLWFEEQGDVTHAESTLMNPEPLVRPHLAAGRLVDLVPGTALEVPLHWHHARLAPAQLTTPMQVGSGYASVAAGYAHTVAVKTDGTLWAWGSNSNGQLGDGTTTGSGYPIRLGR